MKKFLSAVALITVCAVLSLGLFSCTSKTEEPKKPDTTTSAQTIAESVTTPATDADEGLWKDATYKADTELGTGDKTITVVVEIEAKKVNLTIHTDGKTLGEALLALNLIEGENGQYGLYVKKVIGVTADYDQDKAYWSLNQNGEYMMTGVDSTDISDGDQYELVYTK